MLKVIWLKRPIVFLTTRVAHYLENENSFLFVVFLMYTLWGVEKDEKESLEARKEKENGA